MIGRLLALLLGLGGLVIGSQAPGFTLQYMQNLSGRIDELRLIVEKFDAITRDLSITREQYVEDLRAADRESTDKTADVIEETYARYEKLTAHYERLNAASVFMRPVMLAQSFERDIAEVVQREFKPAMPVTADGFAYGAGGFGVLWLIGSIFFGLLGGVFGRR